MLSHVENFTQCRETTSTGWTTRSRGDWGVIKHFFFMIPHLNCQWQHELVGRNKSYFTSDPLNGDNKYTANDICKMIEFLVDNIYVRFGGQLFRQMVGIPMGTNCAPLLADVFLYSYENQFLDKLIKEVKRKLARKFNLSYCYTDDLISFNNTRFKEFISDIYPKELTISETTESTSVASSLDLLFTRDKSNNITTKLYDKCDAFGFHIVNFPFMSSIFHQHQPMVSMHLSSFIMPVVAQIIVNFITPQGPSDKTSVTGLQS